MLAGHNGNYSRYEIERKFLLQRLPDIVPSKSIVIEDTYLTNCRLRLRLEKTSGGEIIGRKLTKKDKVDSTTSIITSLYLSENDLNALWPLKGSTLYKRRYSIEDERQRLIIDVFQGNLEGLILAEVEFLDADACAGYRPQDPSWIEVTENPKYSGGQLACQGLQA